MTVDEVRAMTDEELRGAAWEMIGGCWGEDAPDYPGDWGAAMELFEKARRERAEVFFDLLAWTCRDRDTYQASKVRRPPAIGSNHHFPAYSMYRNLSPRLITEAFVLSGGDS